MRDITLEETIYLLFTTKAFSTNVPTTLAGTPVISAYVGAGLTQITSGVSLSVDHDGVTGLNLITVVATAANGFADETDVSLVITTGTVNAVSVVGEKVGEFSIGRSAAVTELGNSSYGLSALASQLSSLANVGSAVHRAASSYTLTTGTQSANTYVATEPLDELRHEHTDTAGAMDLYYEFDVGAGVPNSCQLTGYVTGNNDDLDIYGYDWVAAAWVQIGNMQGANATDNSVYSFDMFINMVGSGANAGLVRVRLYKASGLTTCLLAIDQIFVAYSQSTLSVLDRIYFDSSASNTNTIPGTDGVPGNPVSTEAAVNALLAAANLSRVEVALESSITFTTSHIDEIWEGAHWTLNQGGQNLSGSHFLGADVNGIATASVERIDYRVCTFETCTLPQTHAINCSLNGGTITFGEAGDYIFSNCHSAVAGASTPVIDTGAAIANVNLTMPNYQQGVEIRNLNNAGTDLFSISGNGQLVFASTCSGNANVRGNWKITDNGSMTIVADDNTTYLESMQGRLPAALVSGRMSSDAVAVGGSLDGATRLGKATQANVYGTIGVGSNLTSLITSSLNPVASVIDQFQGKVMTFDANTTTAALRGQSTYITASSVAGILAVTALTTAPVSGDIFVIT